jgi:hypothetical protein
MLVVQATSGLALESGANTCRLIANGAKKMDIQSNWG